MPSWVAVWVLLFTVVVPTTPGRAVLSALVSVSAVPVFIGLLMASGATSLRLEPAQFFFGLVFPYLLVGGMAYVGARVVYQLGSEVKRARELGSYRLARPASGRLRSPHTVELLISGSPPTALYYVMELLDGLAFICRYGEGYDGVYLRHRHGTSPPPRPDAADTPVGAD